MIVANPIYDSVFKYLMEDERIARTILSALLKKDIVHVEVRPHEYSNSKRDAVSMFRIDFGATVREVDGSEHLILIELQKTWLPTETLRFRQYLGVQYENPRNIVKDSSDQHALPMVCVYLLGHNVGEIEEPVLYVRHQSYDYEGRVVTKGLPDPFVESLTHDSIIVQIPRLHGQINNRLDEVLSVFDQTRKEQDNQHHLCIADDLYPEDDIEMQRILRRLLMAATDADTRMDMNVEDEYYSLIEKQETELLLLGHDLAEKKALLKQAEAQRQEAEAQRQEAEAQRQEAEAQRQEAEAQRQEAEAQRQEAEAQRQEAEAQLRQKDLDTARMMKAKGFSVDVIAEITGLSVEQIAGLQV
ncbi:MAG: hypothetical protein J5486_04635 [Bacteroidaceae bacterium]|nr:hypothetical protein [Bacteroidaceae bacterium]